jgi:membrane-bound serine protease (ClpP class)
MIKVSSAISPATADFIKTGIEKAQKAHAACLVISLDTPGGLSESMRDIVINILASQVPVVVYVAPSGARAASAGVMITMAADIAAMAPGTNIGAAHPVGIGGKGMEGAMSDKVVNDMVAQARSVAEKRGRNAEWVEKAIRESVSVTEKEALEKKIIEIIAEDLDDLIQQIHGKDVKGKGVLEVKEAERITIEEGFRTRILKAISDPNIAYILMMIGLAGLYFELSHPGAIFPGVVGGIAIILAFYSFQNLQVNYAGILLIVLAILFFILEMKVSSFGLLSVAGVVSLLLGSLMLFDRDNSEMRISWNVLIPTLTLVSGFFVVVAGLVFRSQVSKPMTGDKGLVGEIGVVKRRIAGSGKVQVHGEIWQATADREIEEGKRVKVIQVENLVVKVEEMN